MSTTATAQVKISRRPVHGLPRGMRAFSGSVRATGDATGGTTQAKVEFPRNQGLFYMLTHSLVVCSHNTTGYVIATSFDGFQPVSYNQMIEGFNLLDASVPGVITQYARRWEGKVKVGQSIWHETGVIPNLRAVTTNSGVLGFLEYHIQGIQAEYEFVAPLVEV